MIFWQLVKRAINACCGAGLAPGPFLGMAPEDRRAHQVGPPGEAREVPVHIATRRKGDQSSLVISVERKEGRSLVVSIRGSTIGVLVALALLAAGAWILTH